MSEDVPYKNMYIGLVPKDKKIREITISDEWKKVKGKIGVNLLFPDTFTVVRVVDIESKSILKVSGKLFGKDKESWERIPVKLVDNKLSVWTVKRPGNRIRTRYEFTYEDLHRYQMAYLTCLDSLEVWGVINTERANQ